jgi:hypothetical protein
MIEAQLHRLARRASEDPSFLGWQLAAFARVRGFDDDALAGYLGCPTATLANLRICGLIRPEHFRDDVTCVATKFSLNVGHLAEAAKPLPVELAREPGEAETPGVLLAARDRSESQ